MNHLTLPSLSMQMSFAMDFIKNIITFYSHDPGFLCMRLALQV